MKPWFDVVPAERLGKYELVRHLASGGMARIYLARVVGVGGFERHVVLKTVRPERIEDDSYLTMFLDEARLLATLHHQHVAQVYEVGVADDGTYFLAMEYLHGETVRSLLARAKQRQVPLPLDLSLTVVTAAAAGLHHAHERRGNDGQPLGIVHRDVSPSNIICGYDGAVKLIDFGIAKADARSTVTQTGFVKGKAGYMAPEQALGYPVDRRSDVFALGVVMYEMTTGQRAFRAPSEHESVQRMVRGDVTPPSKLVPGYNPELEDVVLTALELDPDDRFATTDEMRRVIEALAPRLGVSLGPAAVARALHELFGHRPEPWLAGSPLGDEPESNVTTESAVVVNVGPASQPPGAVTTPVVKEPADGVRLAPAVRDSSALARGSGGHDAIVDSPAPRTTSGSRRAATVDERPVRGSTPAPRPRTQTLPPGAAPPQQLAAPRPRTQTLPPGVPAPGATQPSGPVAAVARPRTTTMPPPIPPASARDAGVPTLPGVAPLAQGTTPRPTTTDPEDLPTHRFVTIDDLPRPAPAGTPPRVIAVPPRPTGPTPAPIAAAPSAPVAVPAKTLPGAAPAPLPSMRSAQVTAPPPPAMAASPAAPIASAPSAPIASTTIPALPPPPAPAMTVRFAGLAPQPAAAPPRYAPTEEVSALGDTSRRRVLLIGLPVAAALGVGLALLIMPSGAGSATKASGAPASGAVASGAPASNAGGAPAAAADPSRAPTTAPTHATAPSPSPAGARTPAPGAAPAPAPAPAPAAGTTTAPSGAAAPAGATITLHVTTEPTGGTVVLDGVRLGTAPYTATFAATPGRQAVLKVRMHGFIAVKEKVTLDRDVSWDVHLHHAQAAAAPAPDATETP